MYTRLKRMLEKEENVAALLFSLAFIVVFLIGMFKMNDYETQKMIYEDVKNSMEEDNISYEDINKAIIELCKQSSNEQQCLRDFLK